VPADPKVIEFIEKALAAGIPPESVLGVLSARGWPEKELYDALAAHYQRLTGVDVPRRAALEPPREKPSSTCSSSLRSLLGPLASDTSRSP